MKWRIAIVLMILLGGVLVAVAQDITNGMSSPKQLMKNNMNNPTGAIVGGGGGGGGGGCTGLIDASKGCPLPMLGM